MEKLTQLQGKLLEGCIWDSHRRYLYFVDIEKFRIYRMTEEHTLSCLQMPTYVSTIVLTEDGRLLAALQDGLYLVDYDAGKTEKRMESAFPSYLRYNDGKCDPGGRLWVGSMYIDQSVPGARHGASLFCIRDGQVVCQNPGYTIPNGLDWHEGLFYHTETSEKRIRVYRQRAEEGDDIGEQIDEIDLSQEKGSPDGMCVDRDGNLWIAMWGGYQVIGLDPCRKEVFQRILVPDENVSCCAFGGRELNQLFITTARNEKGEGGDVYSETLTCYKGKEGYRYGCKQ